MDDIIKKTRYKTFTISPKIVNYCIFPSNNCDYTQFNSSNLHPHAAKDRGVFRESPLGYTKINKSDWDYKPGPLFSKLLEYKALFDHYNGKKNWRDSKFAKRYFNYININKITDRGLDYKHKKKFLSDRERQIDKLFESIIKKGVLPENLKKNKKLFIDNISLALTRENKLYFNNRGHHRLSIAKIIGLKKIPIKITVSKSEENLQKFFFKFSQ